jgi:hypothetical protein
VEIVVLELVMELGQSVVTVELVVLEDAAFALLQ